MTAKLAGSTLASDYTAGSGCISVVSVADFPVTPFNVAIADPDTREIKLLFRVRSIVGTTFSGWALGDDVNANVGDLVLPPEIRNFSKRFTFHKRW